MPYARISLRKGKSPDYLRTLSDRLHQAMTETFDVPDRDRFHILHQLDENELVFDRTYLAGPRSDDFVLIAITIGKPRSEAVKKAFYKRLVDLLAQSPGIRPEDVMIVIGTSNPEEWSFGNGEAQMTKAGWQAQAAGAAR